MQGDGIIQGLIRDDIQDGSEGLLLHDLPIIFRLDDGRFDEEPRTIFQGLGAIKDLTTSFMYLVNCLLIYLYSTGIYEWSH